MCMLLKICIKIQNTLELITKCLINLMCALPFNVYVKTFILKLSILHLCIWSKLFNISFLMNLPDDCPKAAQTCRRRHIMFMIQHKVIFNIYMQLLVSLPCTYNVPHILHVKESCHGTHVRSEQHITIKQ